MDIKIKNLVWKIDTLVRVKIRNNDTGEEFYPELGWFEYNKELYITAIGIDVGTLLITVQREI